METLGYINETNRIKVNQAKNVAPILRETLQTLNLDLDSIVLHGSVARGEAKKDSDTDLLLVFKQPIAFDTFLADYFFQIREINSSI